MNFFNSSKQTAELIREAESWIGTPFRDKWRTKGVGVDCVQLALGVYLELGVIENDAIPSYSIGAWKKLGFSPIIGYLVESDRFENIGKCHPQPGDLLCFSQGRIAYHLGIYTGEGSDQFLHAITGSGACKMSLKDSTWSKRLVSVYRPKKIT